MKFGRKARLTVMIGVTFVFFVVEIVIGYLSNSNALIADAFHMVSDVLALFIAFVSVHISPKSWSKNTFGFARAEVLGALTNAVFLLALCFTIFTSSIKRFFDVEPVEQPLLVLAVGCVGLACNIGGLCLFHDHGHGHSNSHGHSKETGEHTKVKSTQEAEGVKSKSVDQQPNIDEDAIKGKSKQEEGEVKPVESIQKQSSGTQMNIRGVVLHLAADALGSVIVIISALIIHFSPDWKWKNYVDPTLSIILVLIISCATWPLLKDSAYILLQTVPSYMEVAVLRDRLMSAVPEIDSIHDFHVWQLVATRVVASIHVQLPKDLQDNHMQNAKRINEFFHREGIHSVTVQIEYSGDNTTQQPGIYLCPSAGCSDLRCCSDTSSNLSRIVIIRKS